jgi:glycosyltransferase involved in cell wall biosynthesis
MDVLKKFVSSHCCRIHLIGYNKRLLPADMEEFTDVIVWDESTEAEEVRKFSVGIAPLEDTPFSRGKCAFKSIQYMACGVPVILTPVGANKEIIKHGENGFHAETEADWYRYLEYFYLNRAGIRLMGERNRKLAEEKYCVQSMLGEYMKVFESVKK